MSSFRLCRFYVLLSICGFFSSCGAIEGSFWIKRKLNEIIKPRYYKSFDVDSEIRCGVLCSELYKWRELYYKSNVCYCLAPNYTPLSETIGNQTIDVGDSIYEMFRDRSDCVSRNYTMFSGTNYCLKMIRTPLNWTGAEHYCKQDGGNLVSIETTEKRSNVLSVSQGNNVLVGGFLPVGAAMQKQEYRWISNRNNPINTAFWGSGEPSFVSPDNEKENVVEMHPGGNIDMNDISSSYDSPFMCEILTIN